MKKIYLTIFAILLATAGVMAQAQIGLKAGFNVATVNDDIEYDGAEEPWRPGLNIGIASQFYVNELLSVAPELEYTQRGFLVEYGSGGETNVRYDYLNVPILFRLSFGTILKGYVNAGPTFGYLLGGNYKREGNILGVDYSVDEKISFDSDGDDTWDLDANRLEVGGAIGGGIMLDTEGGSFLIDLRYTQGFTNIADVEETDSYKNKIVSVSLIYMVPSVR